MILISFFYFNEKTENIYEKTENSFPFNFVKHETCLGRNLNVSSMFHRGN